MSWVALLRLALCLLLLEEALSARFFLFAWVGRSDVHLDPRKAGCKIVLLLRFARMSKR